MEICQRPRCNFRHERGKKVGNASGFLRPGSRFIYLRTEHMGHKLRGLLRSVTHSECVNHEVGACGVCGEQGSRQKLLSFACAKCRSRTTVFVVAVLALKKKIGTHNCILIHFKCFEILCMYKSKNVIVSHRLPLSLPPATPRNASPNFVAFFS